jgi:hypothetical protein
MRAYVNAQLLGGQEPWMSFRSPRGTHLEKVKRLAVLVETGHQAPPARAYTHRMAPTA